MALILRSAKGSALTHGELDGNLSSLVELCSDTNVIINGDFRYWDYATSVASPVTAYSANMWYGRARNGGSISRQEHIAGEFSGRSRYFLRWATSTETDSFLISPIEDVRTYAGETVTLTLRARSSTSSSLSTVRIRQSFGSGGSAAVGTTLASSLALTPSWQTLSYTVDLPSISGKTIGNNNYIDVDIRTTDTNAEIDIDFVKLELGSISTPFIYRPDAVERALCQRYAYKIQASAVNEIFAAGWNTSTTAMSAYIPFPTEMRIAPTTFVQSGTAEDYRVLHAATSTNCSAVPTIGTPTPNGARVNATVASGLTAGQGAAFAATNSNAFILFGAEL